MTLQATQIAHRFAKLAPEQRKAFLAKLAENGIDFATLPIVPADDRTALPLSAAQRGLWLTWQREPRSPAYNLTGLVEIAGALDPDRLQAAVDDLVRRHEPLRTTFSLDPQGEPRQRIHPAATVPVRVRDGLDAERSEAFAQALARAPFDLEAGPLLRVELHRLGDGTDRIVLGLHHIAADGQSIPLLLRDLDALYTAGSGQAQPDGLPPLTVQYADYALWQHGRLGAGEAERQAAYWRSELGASPAETPLPLDRPRRAERGASGGIHAFRIAPGVSAALRSLARREGATPFMAALTGFALTLTRYGDGTDVRIGLPLADRARPETRGMVGHLTNIGVLRARIDPRDGFRVHLRQVRDRLLAAQAHADLPFDRIVEASATERRPGLHPLFQVKVTEQAALRPEARFANLPMRLRGLDGGDVHFDLSLDLVDSADGLDGCLAFARDLFDPTTIADLAETFATLLTEAVAEPDRPVFALACPVPEAAAPPNSSAPDVLVAWRARAAEAPEAPALRQGDRSYTRAELDCASDRLAAQLVAHGAGPDTRVALHLGRCPDWVLGLLAVLKSGAAYVPIDPGLPASRRAALVAESAACLVLGDPVPGDRPDRPVIAARFDPAADAAAPPFAAAAAHPASAAYILYTSGSTGRPKGVVVTRGGLARYVAGMLARVSLPAGGRLAMVSTVAADLGNTVLFGALSGGAELDLLDHETALDPDRCAAAVAGDAAEGRRVDALKIAPSHLGALLQAAEPAAVLPDKLLILGGEALRWPLVDRIAALKPGCRVVNHYGPTEATVGALCQEVLAGAGQHGLDRGQEDGAGRWAGGVPIGTPLPGVRAYVLDDFLTPVPSGATGDLYLGGPQLARGYLDRPGLTAERFVPDPFAGPGERLYRTGDRVRRIRDGSLAFVGRSDDQVKIRGHRVEPGEAAAALRGLPGVRDAAIIALAEPDGDGNDGLRLAGYVVADPDLDLSALAAQLAARLPAALVPTSLTRLDALPLTPNGKLNRRALVSLAVGRGTDGKDPPRTGTERVLAALWADLLGLDAEAIGRNDAFADLGGDSILSLKMLARIRRHGIEGGRTLTLAQILGARSLADLAERVAPAAPRGPEVVHLRSAGSRSPLYCIPGLIANATEFADLAAHLGPERPVHGFVSHVYTEARWQGFDVSALSGAYADFIAAHTPGGRCALIGWSSGGDLAFETARRLDGRVRVDFLGLVDVFESVHFAASRVLDADERALAAQSLAGWLGGSRMAEQWQGLIARMDTSEREALDAYLVDNPDLPSDGPDLTAREFELWALLDKRVQAKRHAFAPLARPVHVFQAADSLTRTERLRDWSKLAPVAALEIIPGARHLDILRSTAFQEAIAQALDAAGA
ncbi:amino acid adenylation domain-containing protein [Methylobacterium sp. P1-11]|uniref:non-ribosomal peptide synthetase n=1 Tax=Methylobacterium sp. P1-11 TaxID=2024616 RepID=UPI0011EC61F6|nr:non-ribosomal peptide synthetase [Methylobacterium sp. P1-11]KAA0121075.1 amino acid adenylation domain-containing protein [Methylobacterium sp. P1-11]